MSSICDMEMSKTYQYRKVMKPMLERKRRARINKCLDELKDLMVATLESEGEHITRLEKADILELTVAHLQKLRKQRKYENQHEDYHHQSAANSISPTTSTILSQAEGFRSGFIFAANEVSRNLAKIPGVNVTFGTQLMTHLGQRLNQIQPVVVKQPIPIHQPITIQCHNNNNNLTNGNYCPISPARSIYSVPMSPVSNYSESPHFNPATSITASTTTKSTNFHNDHHQSLLLKQITINNNSCNIEQDENVWRPW